VPSSIHLFAGKPLMPATDLLGEKLQAVSPGGCGQPRWD
jgi:hypothetical protein